MGTLISRSCRRVGRHIARGGSALYPAGASRRGGVVDGQGRMHRCQSPSPCPRSIGRNNSCRCSIAPRPSRACSAGVSAPRRGSGECPGAGRDLPWRASRRSRRATRRWSPRPMPTRSRTRRTTRFTFTIRWVLSPDAVWLCLAQGFAHHVALNAEALRGRFVRRSSATRAAPGRAS
ncbi:DUF4419 domain-containing protein [Sorangium sp. KYC3313]|uniref:DUF4419 domain-containing protein n=1 Tax=Sorangium sp. KYC3313 TaxID=3449740 RepID=UPI003F8C3029